MNHKRKRPKNRRAGCLFCKPYKANGAKLSQREPISALRRMQDKISTLALLALSAVALAACIPTPQPGPFPPDVTPPQDAADAPFDASHDPTEDAWAESDAPVDALPDAILCPDLCCSVCVKLATLGCPESKPTPNGVDCANVCRTVQSFRGLDLKLGAVMTCTDVACVRRNRIACKR